MERKWTGDSRRLSNVDKARIEQLNRAGETFVVIAETVGCSEKSIQRYLRATGDLQSRLKERSARYLSLADREELSRGLIAGESMRGIADRLERAPSTISREVALNGGRDEYRAWKADILALERARRPKPAKLLLHARLRCEVDRRLCERWSPQQIAAQRVREYPDDPSMRVSHETIYKTLFVQARGALRKELTRYLRTGRTQRRPRMRTEYSGGGRLQNMVMISERPAEVEDRAVPGHWEGDLIIGKGGRSAIGTLVERASRFVMLFRLPNGRTADDVRIALTRTVAKLPAEMRRNSPWQRGSNENTNGLLRQYFPSKTDLSLHSAAHLNAVARQLNGRPRETLGWMKPVEVFGQSVASIG